MTHHNYESKELWVYVAIPIIAQMCPTPYKSKVHVDKADDHTWKFLCFWLASQKDENSDRRTPPFSNPILFVSP
jgi:hypothetical protein